MRHWFTADYHLGSEDSIYYFDEPFTSLKHRNETIIRNHNARVKIGDTVHHVGDFCHMENKESTTASQWEKKLNGKIIHIRGNHDYNNSTKTIIEEMIIYYGGQRINLVHNPAMANFNCLINLIGHVHKAWEIKRIYKGKSFTDCVNVGINVNNFMPVSINEIFKKLNQYRKEISNDVK